MIEARSAGCARVTLWCSVRVERRGASGNHAIGRRPDMARRAPSGSMMASASWPPRSTDPRAKAALTSGRRVYALKAEATMARPRAGNPPAGNPRPGRRRRDQSPLGHAYVAEAAIEDETKAGGPIRRSERDLNTRQSLVEFPPLVGQAARPESGGNADCCVTVLQQVADEELDVFQSSTAREYAGRVVADRSGVADDPTQSSIEQGGGCAAVGRPKLLVVAITRRPSCPRREPGTTRQGRQIVPQVGTARFPTPSRRLEASVCSPRRDTGSKARTIRACRSRRRSWSRPP